MNKFKTLVRKSDGQWMKLAYIAYGHCVVVCDDPDIWPYNMTIDDLLEAYSDGIDWLLYDLIEVAVVRVDQINDNDLLQVIKDNMVIGESTQIVTLSINPQAIVQGIKIKLGL